MVSSIRALPDKAEALVCGRSRPAPVFAISRTLSLSPKGGPMSTSVFFSDRRIEAETDEDTAAPMSFAENRYSQFLFQRESIIRNAPESSGVYGLFSAFWIYIGSAENIRERILKHLEGDDPCIVRYRPSGFAFELALPRERYQRRMYLMKELQPLCSGEAAQASEAH
jgi:hypothetical protein